MNLSDFLTHLLSDGIVMAPRKMAVFQRDDLRGSLILLKQLHGTDSLEMPYQSPAFEPDAALWAAKYFFYAAQLILLRDLDEAIVASHLQPFTGEKSPEAIYSVDLIFRHLGSLLRLSNGLAPDDPLVVYLKQIAAAWPFSSVGLNIEPTEDTTMIFDNRSLKYTYIDKIIEHADVARLKGITEQNILKEIMGMHQAKLWPGFNSLTLSH